MDFTILFKEIWRKKWIIIIISIVSAALALFVSLDKKSLYKSTAQIATGFTPKSEAQLQQNYNAINADIRFNNTIQTMTSPIIVNLISYHLILNDLENNNIVPQDWYTDEQNKFIQSMDLAKAKLIYQEKLENIELLTKSDPEEKKMLDLLTYQKYDYESIIKRLVVKRINFSDYIEISFISEYPEISAFVVNTLAKEYIRYNESIVNNISSESISFYKELADKKKQELDRKLDELKIFKSRYQVINPTTESESRINQLAQYQTNRDNENKKLRSLELELERINSQLSEFGPQIDAVNNKLIIDLRNQINLLNSKILTSGRNNQIANDSLQRLRARLDEELFKSQSYQSNKDIKELINQKNQKETELLITQANLRFIDSSISQLRNTTTGYLYQEAEMSALDREIELATAEYTNAQEKFNMAKDASLTSQTSFKIILLGQPADSPEPSKKIIYTGLAGISSFSLSILVILILSYFDFSLRSPSRFSEITGLKLLGSINKLKNKKNLFLSLWDTKSKSGDMLLIREQIKKIRYELEKNQSKVVLFTSTKAREGKTFTMLALTSVLQLKNQKVLLIDSNFKNNELSRFFNARPALESLNDKATEKNPIVTPVKGLNYDLVGSSGGNYSPSEILDENKLRNLIAQYKQEYDYIFLEGGALNEYTDSKELAGFVDNVIAVFSSSSSIKQPDKDSIDYLSSLDGKFLGAILNNVEEDYLEE